MDLSTLRQRLHDALLFWRIPLLVAVHLVVFCGVYWLAFLVRFDGRLPATDRDTFWVGMGIVVAVQLVTFYLLNHFHGWWRHVTFSDMVALGRAALASSLVIVAIDHFLLHRMQIPRGVVVIDWALTVVVLAVLRSLWRLWDEQVSLGNGNGRHRRALLVGDDSDAARMAYLINSQPQIELRVVGLVAPEATASGSGRKSFGGIRVLGTTGDMARLVAECEATSVVVPTGSLSGPALRGLLDVAREAGFEVHVVPNIDHHFHGETRVPIREVRIEDLLRRDPVVVDDQAIGELVDGKTILVTGAGGSIGSELCRQLARFAPRRLLLLGRGENRIFHIERELQRLAPHLELVPVIASTTDRRRIEELLARYRPELVLHAAAHKHVPLSEANVGEAVRNNVLGTRILADAAARWGVERFLQISTDKTVNPTSVMGCTKLIADRYCLAMDGQGMDGGAMDSQGGTRFVVTRFGNVLGSEGSVVPLFKKQIREGGPITITDPRMTRFFMTIPEATQLVLQSAAIGQGGNVYVLEMGEQVRIVDMAHDLIRFAGLSPGAIDIEYTGVRPGEKLYEELFYDDQEVGDTEHEKIKTVYCGGQGDDIRRQVEELIAMVYEPPDTIRAKLAELVPEFTPPVAEAAVEERVVEEPAAT